MKQKKEMTIKEWASKGGKISAERLTPEQRSARAKKASDAYWKKPKEDKK